MDENGTVKHGGWVEAGGAEALPPLKLSGWISIIPTYNSGIERYSNYAKHPGRVGGREGGGGAYKCGKIACVSSSRGSEGVSAPPGSLSDDS